jgi:putative protease
MTKENKTRPELVCPAGTPAALKTAVDAGADSVYCGFRNETNARNFPGLNFSREELAEGIEYAHTKGSRVLVAINTYPQAGRTKLWKDSIDTAIDAGADAVIIADLGLAGYLQKNHPKVRLHLSVQASASTPETINYYMKEFGVKRVVLPRVLTVPEIAALNREIECETEVFVFGGLCVMAEGRCCLSSYATGKSPNMSGVCSPASHVRYEENPDGTITSKLGEFVINRIAKDENAGYPTTCKGRYKMDDGQTKYIFEEPGSLNAADILPELLDAGVTALKIEGRQRSRAYVSEVVSAFRSAIDDYMEGKPPRLERLQVLSEGRKETQGAYKKTWR